MTQRRLTKAASTPEALAKLLEHGTMADWGPLMASVRDDPDGVVAGRVIDLIGEHDYGKTGTFWTGFITEARTDRDRSSVPRRQG